MATKKPIPLRVHQLAKELGVNSKDILSKCVAEGIEGMKDHLSPVSVGLAATVREWFGKSAQHTAIETAQRVDVDAARSKPGARRGTRARGEGESAGDGSATSTLEAPAEPGGQTILSRHRPGRQSISSTPGAIEGDIERSQRFGDVDGASSVIEPMVTTPALEVGEQASPDEPAQIGIEAVAPSAPPAVSSPTRPPGSNKPATATPIARATRGRDDQGASDAIASVEPGGDEPSSGDDRRYVTAPPKHAPVMNIPTRPTDVKPVGPMLARPEKIEMSGPRVIRVEAPEQLAAPRPMNRAGGAAGRGPAGAGGAGAAARGNVTNRRNERRRSNAGEGPSGRSGRAFVGSDTPFQPWRPQDLVERDQRLQKSGGFIRSHRRDMNRGGPAGRAAVGARAEGPIKVAEPVTVKELSAATGVKTADILKKLLLSGTMATINSTIDSEKAMEVMLDLGIEIEIVEQQSAEEHIAAQFAKRESVDVKPRAPVVTILGHVDHGKTSLLDRIRNANVAAGEAGGITQKTSAFQVPVHAGDRQRLITFIDTPGHEAFTGMRARGAKVTDIVVLVVAADDGVMPQTVESINHAKAANVPIVVALNKIDKPEATEANITRIFGQLNEHGLNPVEWGGATEVIRTSATKATGIQELLDILDYQAELLGLTGDLGGQSRGTVLEARMEEGRGPVANMIVQEGTLKKGNFIVIGRAYGRVRDIMNDRGQRIEEAPPSTPIAISGIDTLPDAGDKFFVVGSLKEAEAAAEERKHAERQRELATPKITLDNIFEHLQKGTKKELALVIKADVHGSLETLKALVPKLSNDEVTVSIKHAAVGGITEADVTLAEATNAVVIGFNVTTSAKIRQLAEDKGIDVRLYEIIYNITDDLSKAILGLLEPELKLEVLGHADVRQVFRISKVGSVAGCYVTDGVIERNAQIRVTRSGIVVEKDRRLEQLKRFKDDAKEVRAGQECGMKIQGYDDIHEGDVLECYKTISVARTA